MAVNGKEKRRRGRPTWCFFAGGGDPSLAEGGGGRLENGKRQKPTHLVVTVNGIVGSAGNWRFAAKKIIKRYPEDIIVHCSKCNYSTLTFDGVDIMGERLAKEVMSVVAQRPELRSISFVAHSLGGLIARYAIGILYGQSALRNSSGENGENKFQESATEYLEQKSKGRIAGLDPMNFITFATPHLGSRWHKQIPILCGSYTLEKMAHRISSIAGRTGKHLFLKDKDDGKPPLLLQMISDYGDFQFISALQSFKRCVAYSNVSSDFIVGWKTSSIRCQQDLPKCERFTKNLKYPHVVYVEKPKSSSMQNEDFSENTIYQLKSPNEIEDTLIKGLNRVPWERVDVNFRKSRQRIFAHSTIQVKTYAINSAGKDVIFHMIDNFLL
ncbi:hypothetical protein J5N97_024641 [Dioscorea zingiberensis]|uniref:DUF676 domain-containing protein n=1 Tax=Dioscorea zingiberensis TaxID=325984 RepID=A0A9D5C7T9_9LILI|nr:hypothetical protein J5N97_024641 [Dioscorea zingiberensis]